MSFDSDDNVEKTNERTKGIDTKKNTKRSERRESIGNTQSIDALGESLEAQSYIAERGLLTSIYLSLKLNRPLFLEGEAGVGKTEIAKVLAACLDTELVRLQCYEGLDVSQAVYEWNYTRQMMQIRLAESQGARLTENDLFSREFLLARPLLRALETSSGAAPVLLIDEVDRSDEEFEAYLLEILSDFQITIPEIGTIRSASPPAVVLTSNRTREVHDALKRRCLYYWIDYPDFEKELQIVRRKLPEAPLALAEQVTRFVQELREIELYKVPGVAETLDWVQALNTLNCTSLDRAVVDETLGAILKYREDVDLVRKEHAEVILDRVKATG